jgi:hypothetical protein
MTYSAEHYPKLNPELARHAHRYAHAFECAERLLAQQADLWWDAWLAWPIIALESQQRGLSAVHCCLDLASKPQPDLMRLIERQEHLVADELKEIMKFERGEVGDGHDQKPDAMRAKAP